MGAPEQGASNMQHKLRAATALTTIGMILALTSQATAQVRRAPLPAQSGAPTGSSGAPAREAAYGERPGDGRSSTPTFQESQPSSTDFGRPNPGRPEFEDPDYRGGGGATGASPSQASNGGRNGEGAGDQNGEQGQGQGQGQENQGQENQGQGNQGQNNQGQDGDASVLQVADGFFFDNYTSGSGFGVYGGEAVTSGSGTQQELPSAGVIFRNLGILP